MAITELHESLVYRTGDDGLQHRSAWAGAGDGVLLYDADGDGKISDRQEYMFTDWAPRAEDDMEALRWKGDNDICHLFPWSLSGRSITEKTERNGSEFWYRSIGPKARLPFSFYIRDHSLYCYNPIDFEDRR